MQDPHKKGGSGLWRWGGWASLIRPSLSRWPASQRWEACVRGGSLSAYTPILSFPVFVLISLLITSKESVSPFPFRRWFFQPLPSESSFYPFSSAPRTLPLISITSLSSRSIWSQWPLSRGPLLLSLIIFGLCLWPFPKHLRCIVADSQRKQAYSFQRGKRVGRTS